MNMNIVSTSTTATNGADMSDPRESRAPRLGRPCVTCTHPDRLAVEQQIVEAVPLRTIAALFKIPRSSIRRHLAAHMELDEDLASHLGLDPESLAIRAYDVAERARDIAADALDDGDHGAALRAGDAELRALAALAALGARNEARISEYEMFRTTAHAVIRAARTNPVVAEAVAAQLDIVDRRAIAADVRAQITGDSSPIP